MEPIFKYQYLIDKVLNLKISIAHNPNSIFILNKKPELIDWYHLSKNPNAIKILEKNLDKVDWSNLSSNPVAIKILEQNVNNICWYELSANPNAIHLLEKNLDKVNWSKLSLNPNAIHLLEANLDKIDWNHIVLNPNAINLIEKNLDKLQQIHWYELSKNPNAISIIEKNLDKILWDSLSLNPNAIHILEANLEKVSWENLAHNTKAFHLIDNYLNYLNNLESLNAYESDNYFDITFNISINSNSIHLIKKLIPSINYKYLAMNEKGLDILQDYMIENDKFYDRVLASLVRVPNYIVLKELTNNVSLFDLDYVTMAKKRNKLLYSEIITKAMHPNSYGKFLDYHLEQGNNIHDFDIF